MGWLYITICLTQLLLAHCVYDNMCPSSSQWRFRQKSMCTKIQPEYFCLYDVNNKNYTEFCGEEPVVDKDGNFVVIVGDMTSAACNNDRYQPYTYYTTGNPRCVLSKSICSDIGQIVFNNGTTTLNRKCRCDYSLGYSFVTKPKNFCECDPSEEDCSCYFKKCLKGTFLTPDYNCQPLIDWTAKFRCPLITSFPRELVTSTVPTHVALSEYEHQTFHKPLEIYIITGFVCLYLGVSEIIFFLSDKEQKQKQEKSCDSSVVQIQTVKTCGNHLLSNDANNDAGQVKDFEVFRQIVGQAFSNQQQSDWSSECPRVRLDIDRSLEKEWRLNDKKTVDCKSIDFIWKYIQGSKFVLIHGPTGSGKTTILRHIALKLCDECGYEIINANLPSEIFNPDRRGRKSVFIYDDVFGSFRFDRIAFDHWIKLSSTIDNIDAHGFICVVLASSRTSIIESLPKIEHKFSTCQFNIISPELILTQNDKSKIAETYLPSNILGLEIFEAALQQTNFPFLCKLYHLTHNEDVFNTPKQCIKTKLDTLFSDLSATVILVFLVVSNNHLTKDIYTSLAAESMVKSVLRGKEDINHILLWRDVIKRLSSFQNEFVKQEGDALVAEHDIIFDTSVSFIQEDYLELMIEYSSPRFIAERFQFESLGNTTNERIISLSGKMEQLYFHRLVKDLSNGFIEYVFTNRMLQYPDFCTKFISQLQNNTQVMKTLKSFGIGSKSPLLMSTLQGQNNVVSWLADLLDINVTDESGRSLIYIATEYSYIDTLKTLLHNGCDCNLYRIDKGHKRETPLLLASTRGHLDITELLLKSGANPNLSNKAGLTPLFAALNNGCTELVKLLLKFGANANKMNNSGKSPLHISVANGHKDIVRQLLIARADCNVFDADRRTPLFAASEAGYLDIVTTLLDFKANPDLLDLNNRSPLLISSEKGDLNIVCTLLGQNADPNICNSNTVSPLYAAIREGHVEVAEVLILNGAETNIWYYPDNISHNTTDDKSQKERISPLYLACKKGSTSIVDLLLKHGADPNIDCIVNTKKRTPLYEASKHGYEEIVSNLLQFKSNPNYVMDDNKTALYAASKRNCIKIVKILLENKTDIQPGGALSPIKVAKDYKHWEIYKYLKQKQPLLTRMMKKQF